MQQHFTGPGISRPAETAWGSAPLGLGSKLCLVKTQAGVPPPLRSCCCGGDCCVSRQWRKGLGRKKRGGQEKFISLLWQSTAVSDGGVGQSSSYLRRQLSKKQLNEEEVGLVLPGDPASCP